MTSAITLLTTLGVWVSRATTGPASQADGARHRAGLMLLLLAGALLAVFVAMLVWTMHWARRLRQPAQRPDDPPAESPDPWVQAGQRLNVPRPPSGQEDAQ